MDLYDDTNKNKIINQFRSVDFFRKSNHKLESTKVSKEIIKEKILNKILNITDNVSNNNISDLENVLFQGDQIDNETLMEIKKKNPHKYEILKRAALDTRRSNKDNNTNRSLRSPSPDKTANNRKFSHMSITSDTTNVKGQKIPILNIKDVDSDMSDEETLKTKTLLE